MKTINLLPKEEQKEIALETVFSHVLMFWILAGVSLVVFFILILATKFYLDHKITTIEDEIALNQTVLNSSDYKGLQDQILQLNSSVKEIKNLQAQHYAFSQSLIALSDVISPNVQLNQMTFDRESGKIDINGQARTREDVIALWSEVIKSAFFEKINFPLTNLERAKIANFSFTFYLKKDKVKQ